METNAKGEEVQSWKSQIHKHIEASKWREQGSGSMKRVMEECLQQMATVTHNLYGLGAPTTTNMLGRGLIKGMQQNRHKRRCMSKTH